MDTEEGLLRRIQHELHLRQPRVETALAQEANTNPVPAVDGAQVAANADAITPRQQVNYNYFY